MGLEDRAKAALSGNKKLSSIGDKREEIQVLHSGISEDEAEQHDWVVDAVVIDDSTINLVVKYETEIHIRST